MCPSTRVPFWGYPILDPPPNALVLSKGILKAKGKQTPSLGQTVPVCRGVLASQLPFAVFFCDFPPRGVATICFFLREGWRVIFHLFNGHVYISPCWCLKGLYHYWTCCLTSARVFTDWKPARAQVLELGNGSTGKRIKVRAQGEEGLGPSSGFFFGRERFDP